MGHQKMNVEFLNPFVDAVVHTLKIQCNTVITAGKPFLKDADKTPVVDIAGVIGITSKAFNGSIAICYPEKTFLGLMGGMFGETFASLTKELEDGAGELLNIIFGQAKVKLNEKGFAIERAIPTIVTGSTLKVRHLAPAPTIVLPFDTTNGNFYVEICVDGPGLADPS